MSGKYPGRNAVCRECPPVYRECEVCYYKEVTDYDLFLEGLQRPIYEPTPDHERFMYDNYPPGTVPPRYQEEWV